MVLPAVNAGYTFGRIAKVPPVTDARRPGDEASPSKSGDLGESLEALRAPCVACGPSNGCLNGRPCGSMEVRYGRTGCRRLAPAARAVFSRLPAADEGSAARSTYYLSDAGVAELSGCLTVAATAHRSREGALLVVPDGCARRPDAARAVLDEIDHSDRPGSTWFPTPPH